jgi:hypothetical protein
MSSLSKGQAFACVALVVIVLAPTSLVLYEKTLPTPESMFNEGRVEFTLGNYGTASELFGRSSQGYEAAGDHAMAMQAQNWKFKADRILTEYCLDREAAEKKLADTFPWVPEEERNSWLDLPTTERIVSDGKVWFYESIANNIAFRNMTLYHEWKDDPVHDMMKATMVEILSADANRTGTYFNPANYTAHGVLTLPRDILPSTGTLQIWVPAPIDAASQCNVKVLGVSPADCVVTMPDVHGSLGQAYLEIPLEGLIGNVTVTVDYSFTEYQKHFDVDPSNVGSYDRTSSDYLTYTRASENSAITPEIYLEAKSVIGDETNPYLQAKLLYDYVIGNITYSFMPHVTLGATGVPESEYVRIHRFGDCGAQSMYLTALLRSIGIPARAVGGYQTLHGGTSSHFWSEFYVPNYGWVPCDVTAADGMSWISSDLVTPSEVAAYKAYFFGHLDHCRYIIQNSTDIHNVPEPLMPYAIFPAFQFPTASCDTATVDLPVWANFHWAFKITMVA